MAEKKEKIHPISIARRAMNKKMTLAAFLVLAAIVGSGVMVWSFAEVERGRDIYNWQVRLGLIAESQKNEIESWVERQFSHLAHLSDNQSLQLYMTELELLPDEFGGLAEEEPVETTFLRNLLTVTAKRGNFLAPPPKVQEVRANIEEIGVSGIALINNEGKIIVTTRGMPAIDGKLRDFLNNIPRGKKVLLDMYEGPKDAPTMAFAMPVYSIQGDRQPDQQIGIVLGVKPVEAELAPLLEVPYSKHKSAESILVRLDEGAIQYLSPLQNGKKSLEQKMAYNTPDLVGGEAIKNPGSFIKMNDYRYIPVLATSQRIEGTQWYLIHKVDRKDALADSNARLNRLIGIFVLAVLVIFIGVIAAWRHGSSLKSEKVALRYKKLFNRFKSQEHLLRLVSDNQPDAMLLVDTENRYCFANYKSAKDAGVSTSDVVGKSLPNVLGPNKARIYQELNAKALSVSAAVSHIQRYADRVVQTKHIPISHIPNILADDETSGVLVVEQDITELFEEREKQERTLDQLINCLVSIVDKHDPYAADHSSRVSKIAKAIADEMDLEPVLVETAQIAGRLMNLGKILLPSELLVKTDSLKKEEIKTIHESIYESANFLKDINFDGPVVETLHQCLENWDGSGPKGMKGEDILITARIISVANSFIAMLSERAYRDKLSQDEAFKRLLSDVDTKFQRSVVAALINFVENREGNLADFF